MSCNQNVSLVTETLGHCECVMLCSSDETGSRTLATVDAAVKENTPVATRDGVEYTELEVADLTDPTVLGFGFVTAAADAAGKAEVHRTGEFAINRVVWPAAITSAADKAQAVSRLRAAGLKGVALYA